MQGSTWAWSVEGALTRAACADVLAAKVGDLRGRGKGGGEEREREGGREGGARSRVSEKERREGRAERKCRRAGFDYLKV